MFISVEIVPLVSVLHRDLLEMTSIDKTAESMSYIHSVIRSRMTDESDKKVIKGAWWMPWLTQAMKDVISCDKLR